LNGRFLVFGAVDGTAHLRYAYFRIHDNLFVDSLERSLSVKYFFQRNPASFSDSVGITHFC
jgi:hypothetical protein